jgi:putative membrane protein
MGAVRLLSFAAGCLVMAWALSPAFDAAADGDFGVHMAQHLLVAMIGPTALVLGAPLTTFLRGSPRAAARRVARLLRSLPVHLLTRPVTALTLSSGGLIGLYFTPLYAASTRSGTVHALVHLHLIAAGLLFAWVIAGPDPAPGRAGVRSRLLALGAAVAVHASVAQLIFAGMLVQVREPIDQMRAAGNLMYFGGDLAELLLAIALLATWRPAPRSPSSGGAAPPRSDREIHDEHVRLQGPPRAGDARPAGTAARCRDDVAAGRTQPRRRTGRGGVPAN